MLTGKNLLFVKDSIFVPGKATIKNLKFIMGISNGFFQTLELPALIRIHLSYLKKRLKYSEKTRR